MIDGEIVYGVLGGSLKLGMFKSTAAAVVVTNRRLVYAIITDRMTKEAVKRSSDQAKEDGRGFLGRMGAALTATSDLVKGFALQDPDDVASMNPDNFSVPVDSVVSARFDRVTNRDAEGSYNGETQTFHLATNERKLKLTVTIMTTNPVDMLRSALGSRLVKGKNS